MRWTFADSTAKHTYVTDVQASNNIAITPLHTGTPFLLHATWFAAGLVARAPGSRVAHPATATAPSWHRDGIDMAP